MFRNIKITNTIFAIIMISLLIFTQACGIADQEENNNTVNDKLITEEEQSVLNEINNTLQVIKNLEGKITSEEDNEFNEIIEDLNELILNGELEDIQAKKEELVEKTEIIVTRVTEDEQVRIDVVIEYTELLKERETAFNSLKVFAKPLEINNFNEAVEHAKNSLENGSIDDIYIDMSSVGQYLREIYTSNDEAKEISRIGFELMRTESLDFLQLGVLCSEVINEIGEPDRKSEAGIQDYDGNLHQTWFYDSLGITLWLTMNPETETEYDISGIRIENPCKYMTKRDIGIASTQDELFNTYKDEILVASDFDERIIVGTIYGGIIFEMENEYVVSISIGIFAE